MENSMEGTQKIKMDMWSSNPMSKCISQRNEFTIPKKWIYYLKEITCTHTVFEALFTIAKTQWHPTPALLPGKSHGPGSLVGCSPWGRWKSDTTEWLHFHFSLSCIGEGDGSPPQCFCLENPRDGGAWWAAVYGVTQSQTRLKRLSGSSSKTWK